MKFQIVRMVELSLLVLLLIACVGAISTISPLETPRDNRMIPAPRELQNRFLEYLNSPLYP